MKIQSENKFYKYTRTCIKCQREYGTDYKHQRSNGKICTKCDKHEHRKAWRKMEMK